MRATGECGEIWTEGGGIMRFLLWRDVFRHLWNYVFYENIHPSITPPVHRTSSTLRPCLTVACTCSTYHPCTISCPEKSVLLYSRLLLILKYTLPARSIRSLVTLLYSTLSFSCTFDSFPLIRLVRTANSDTLSSLFDFHVLYYTLLYYTLYNYYVTIFFGLVSS